MQREIEKQGLSTAGITLAREISEQIKPPRTLSLAYPFGHPFGEPHRKPQQRRILLDLLELLENAEQPGEIRKAPYRWRRHRFT